MERFGKWIRRHLPERWRSGDESRIPKRYRQTYDQLTHAELTQQKQEISYEQILDELAHPDHRSADKFLNYYSLEGGFQALERYGFLQILRDHGFSNPLVSADTRDPDRHILRIHFDQRDPDHLLVEMSLQFRHLALPAGGPSHRMLSIEWLLLQNPSVGFSEQRPPLPDQQHPGLGLFHWAGELLRLMATRLDCAGLMNNPSHLHNAVIYGKKLKFVDPHDEGRLRALERDLASLPLHEATAAVDAGLVRDAEGDVLRWEGRPQVLPIVLQLQQYFESTEYQLAVEQELNRTRYQVAPVAPSSQPA